MTSHRFSFPAVALLALLFPSGCMLLGVAEDHERDAALVRLTGTVALEDGLEAPVVVVLLKRADPDVVYADAADYFVRHEPGSFYFAVLEPGAYSFAAFADLDGDLVYDPDEPGVNFHPEMLLRLSEGDTADGIELVVGTGDRITIDGADGYDLRAFVEAAAASGLVTTSRTLARVGEVVDLADVRFGPENGRRGLWEAWDFVIERLEGVYFLEPYDPDRIPVLFVHGISGHPQEFTVLVESLDRERYQPWFVFYPSGEHLFKTAGLLVQLVTELRLRHGFDQMAVVAHSMGGLVSRDFLLQYDEATGLDTVPVFVSISTPWGGHAAADSGVDAAPVVVYSWNQMATKGGYVPSLFFEDPDTMQTARRLPAHLTHHLVFGLIDGEATDGVVSIASELHAPAQAQAATVYGVHANHRDILSDPLTVELVNGYLDAGTR